MRLREEQNGSANAPQLETILMPQIRLLRGKSIKALGIARAVREGLRRVIAGDSRGGDRPGPERPGQSCMGGLIKRIDCAVCALEGNVVGCPISGYREYGWRRRCNPSDSPEKCHRAIRTKLKITDVIRWAGG